MESKIIFSKIQNNLIIFEDLICSYSTVVAKIDHNNKKILVNNYYSKTTTKHINKVSELLNYQIEKNY
jgi:hypothetical protein